MDSLPLISRIFIQQSANHFLILSNNPDFVFSIGKPYGTPPRATLGAFKLNFKGVVGTGSRGLDVMIPNQRQKQVGVLNISIKLCQVLQPYDLCRFDNIKTLF